MKIFIITSHLLTVIQKVDLQVDKKIQIQQQIMMEDSQGSFGLLPRKPKTNYSKTNFQNISIYSNLYYTSIKPIQEIHIFKIDIFPHVMHDDRTTRNKVLSRAFPSIQEKIKQPIISGLNIYSLTATSETDFHIDLEDFQVKLKKVKTLVVKDNPHLMVHFLNNGLRNLLQRMNFVEIGKSGKYFSIQNKRTFENLHIFSGYKVNFLDLEGGIYLRLDTAKKIVRNKTVLMIINEFYLVHKEKERDYKRNIIKNELIGKIVMTNYGKARYMKIMDIQFIETSSVLVSDANLTIIEYFQEKYNIKIQHKNQPLLVMENRRAKNNLAKTYMLPELCLMTGVPDDFDERSRRKLSESLMYSTTEKLHEINELMKCIKNTNEANSLKDMGITINEEIVKVNGKKIGNPEIYLGDNDRVESGKQSFFNIRSQSIFSNQHCIKLCVISFNKPEAFKLINNFKEAAQKLKINLNVVEMELQLQHRSAVHKITNIVDKAVTTYECNCCLILIPSFLKSQYKTIKHRCLIQSQVICQIVTESSLQKTNFPSIITKVLLQIAAKRGNILWVPEYSKKLKNTMLVGFDTSKNGGSNVVSGVATINSTFSVIVSQTQQFEGNNDKLYKMIKVFVNLIRLYVERNKNPPSEIIVFSNSCSSDQIKLFHEYFIEPAIKQLQVIYSEALPKFMFIFVNCKSNQRFYEIGNNHSKNVPAGTVICEDIVSKHYNFYLVSQHNMRGCTVPNNYQVVYSTSCLDPGILQQLIYYQCFNYLNWTGSIKIPAILQYAKKCARFNAQILGGKKVNEKIEKKLYFI